MMYLTEKDAKVLTDILEMINGNHVLIEVDPNKLYAFDKLVTDSIDYTAKCREKAKRFVQEKRKTDKSYAHKKKEQ